MNIFANVCTLAFVQRHIRNCAYNIISSIFLQRFKFALKPNTFVKIVSHIVFISIHQSKHRKF